MVGLVLRAQFSNRVWVWVNGMKSKMFVVVIAFQQPRADLFRTSVGGGDAFADAVAFFRAFVLAGDHRKKIKNKNMVVHFLAPDGLGKLSAGWCHLVAEPSDVFPQGLSAAAGIANFKLQSFYFFPIRIIRGQVTVYFD